MSRLIDMRDGEIVSVEETTSSIPVLMHQNPFSQSVKHLAAAHGTTLHEMVQKAALSEAYHDVVRVWVNDEEVPREVWGEYIPAEGTNVYVRVVPQKGGKDIFRAIAMVIIAVVAWEVIGPWAAAGLGLTEGTLTFTIASALVATAVTAVGYMALNALIPPPGLQKDKNDQKYRLTGTQNTFSPYANIPRVIGKRRIFPLHAGRPYSEIQGDDEYLRICLVVGWGPLAITNIKIGETPISAFDGVEYETREGWSTDAALTLYSKTVVEDNFAYQLEPYTVAAGTYYPGGYGYYGEFYKHDTQTDTYSTVTTTSTNGWASRTSQTNAVELSVDVQFPSGLFFFNSRGNREQATVQLDVQYRAVGSGTWLNVTWANSTDAGFNVAGKITVTASETSAVRRSGRIKLPSVGQYEVQMRRVTANSGDKYVDLVWWSTLRTIKADYPILEKNLALIALRIKATGQLNGVPSAINCEAESYLPTTDLTQNLNLYSSTLENWTKSQTGMVVTANATLGPFGTTTADNVANAVSLSSSVSTTATHEANKTYTRSFYAKHISGTGIIVSSVANASPATSASFNLQTGVATLLSGSPATCSMTAVSNGFYRCTHTYSTGTTLPTQVVLLIGANGATATATTIAIEGVQTEEASTAGTFTATTTAIKPLWSYALSSNPAWGYCDILRRRNGATFLADSRIDLASIYAWATACATTAPNASEPRWSFNGVIEGGSVYEALRLIASNARANYTMRDGKHSVVRDILQTVPVQHITPRNSTGYSGSKTFLDYPHALRVTFVNSSKGYQDDERIVYYDGYDSTNATKFETLQLEGCTSSTQAFREARYHMAVARLRPEEHTVTMDIEALRCTVGDLVRFSHDACAIGIQSSRVKAITTSAGNVTAITLDDEVYFEAAKAYVLRARLSADGSTVLVSLVNPGAGYVTTVTLTTPTAIASAPGVGDLVVYGESSKETAEMIVKKIQPGEDFKVELTLVDAAPAIHTADTGTIPAWTSNLTLPNLPTNGSVPPVYISAVRSDDSVVLINIDGSISYRMFVQMQQPEGTTDRIEVFELQYKLVNNVTWETARVERAQPFYYVDRVKPGDIYLLRVRGVTTSGAEGVWSTTVTHTVLGKTNAPAVPTALTATAIPGGITLKWTDPDINDLWQTEVYENTTNASGTATLVATVTANTYDRLGLSAASGIRYYWIKSVDTTGNKSAFVGPASATALNKGLYINTTNDAAVLPADAAGNVASFSSAVGLMTVFDGDTDVTASATLSFSLSNVTGTVNTAASTPVAGQPKGYYSVTAMSADAGSMTLTAQYNSVTVSKVFSVAKARAGTAGADSVTISMSKNSVSLMAYADGTVVSFADAVGQITVYYGATDVTASATFSVAASGCTGTVNTATGTPVAAQPKGYFQVTAMSADTATLTFTITYNTVPYNRVFTLSKSKTGYEIVGVLPTTNLFAGRMVFLTTDNKLYRYNGTAWTAAVAGSDITAGTLAATAFANTIEPVSIGTSPLPSTKTTNTIFNTTDSKLYRWNGTAYVATIPSTDLTASWLTAGAISAGAIGTNELAANAITVGKLAVTGVGASINADPLGQDSSAWITLNNPLVFLTGITDAPAGSTAVANTAGSFCGAATADYLPVDQNKKYRLDAWLKAVAGTAGTAALGVIWYDASKTQLSANVAQPTGAGSPSGWTNGTYSFYFGGTAGATAPTTWTKYSIAFGSGEAAAIPSNARFLRVVARLNQSATAAAQIAVTSVRVMEKAESDLIVDGSITTAKMTANTINGDRIAAGTITAAKIGVTDLSSINANIGTVTAGIVQNSTGSAKFDLTNAKIIFDNGSYMKVTGIGFGASSNYLEWYGPTVSSASNFAACTDTNAIYYLKTTGVAYFGGTTESPKVTRTYRAQGTVFTATETVPLGVSKCVIELFGAGGGGGAGTGTGNSGGGGGSGAYCRTTVAVTAGSTFSMSLAALASGGASGGNGGSASSSTISGSLITTMTAPGGGGGVGTTGGSTAGAAAAIATGGTDSNLTGVAGTAGGAAATVPGGAGRAGYTETGANGGTGSNININTGPGQSGDNYFAILGYRVGAQAVFRYF